MSVSIQGLRVFLGILEHGSLTAAGRKLVVTQPAVSNHLHLLEEKFGVTLLTRGRGLRATPAGECLADHARRVLEEISAMEDEMSRHSAPCGRLLVGASSTPGEILLPRLAVRYSAEYPEVALDVHIADTEETLQALMERKFEVAIVGREVAHSGVESTVIEEDELVPVVATSEKRFAEEIEPADLADRPFIMREQGSATRDAVEARLASAGIKPRIAMELGSNAAVAGAVAAGDGVGVLPARSLDSQSRVRRIQLRSVNFSRPFVLLVESGRPLSPAAEAFVETCIEIKGQDY